MVQWLENFLRLKIKKGNEKLRYYFWILFWQKEKPFAGLWKYLYYVKWRYFIKDGNHLLILMWKMSHALAVQSLKMLIKLLKKDQQDKHISKIVIYMELSIDTKLTQYWLQKKTWRMGSFMSFINIANYHLQCAAAET